MTCSPHASVYMCTDFLVLNHGVIMLIFCFHSCDFNSFRPSDAFICMSKLTVIGSDNGLLAGQPQAIIWTNAGIFLIRLLETHFSEITIEINTFSFKKMHWKMSSAKWWTCCLGLNVFLISCTVSSLKQAQSTQQSVIVHIILEMYEFTSVMIFMMTVQLIFWCRKLEYSLRTRPIPWLLMPWLIAMAGHQQLWNRLNKIKGPCTQPPVPWEWWERQKCKYAAILKN